MTKKTKKFRSELSQAVHEGVRSMHRLGLVDKKTMREFDLRCHNLTTGQISQLERGAKHAREATLKLHCLIEEKR